MSMARRTVQSLVELGLTTLEVAVYTFLVENSPATGYRVAKSIGKPTANTYRAIQSLEEKGWVLVEDSTSRLCRAVPVEEALGGLERRFQDLKAQAHRELMRLKAAPDDERLYHLSTPAQVFERLRRMLGSCETIALLDLFPRPLEEMHGDIAVAAARGITIAIKAYHPCEIPGTEIVVDARSRSTLERWPGMWANCVVDGREHLLALLSADTTAVLQAVWSAHTYTSWVYHSGLMHELLYGALAGQLDEPEEELDLSGQYRRLLAFRGEAAPGYQALLERLGTPEEKDNEETER